MCSTHPLSLFLVSYPLAILQVVVPTLVLLARCCQPTVGKAGDVYHLFVEFLAEFFVVSLVAALVEDFHMNVEGCDGR